jgi:anti-sigma regulatory factor (Ser/Thr protein kinase)
LISETSVRERQERATGQGTLEVSLHNRREEIAAVHQALDGLATQYNLPSRLVTHLHIALEEHLTNIISYGYQPGQVGTIRVRFMLESSALRIEIEDNAKAFDPTAAPEVNVLVPLDNKPLGGLGLLMIRKSADELEYRRADGRNLLTIKKRIE